LGTSQLPAHDQQPGLMEGGHLTVMRVLVVNYEYPPLGGGGGFVTRDILEHMVSLGHDITVVTSHRPGLTKDEFVNGVRVIRVPVFFRSDAEVASIPSMLCYFPSSLLTVLSRFSKKRFDLINTHFAIPSGPVGYVLSKRFNIPNVLSIHGGDIYDPSKPYSPHRTPVLSHTVRAMLNTADRIVAQSTNTRDNAVKYYGTKKKIDIIPLGIRKPKFLKKNRIEFDVDENIFVFCTIGRLVKRKNIHDILTVLARLQHAIRFQFFIIGDGPERKGITAAIQQLGLGDCVRLLGNVPDDVKFQVLDLSDAYLSTAQHEGFGLVFLEAMECGLPIICYNNGGQTDFLVNGKTGFLTDVGDLDEFKNKILQLYTDKDLRARIREYNKNLMNEFYISRCADKYIALFEDIISKQGAIVSDTVPER